MDGMSEREYSDHSGLSREAVQSAKRGGRLVFYQDGSINAAASDVRRAEMTAHSTEVGHRFHSIVGSHSTRSWAAGLADGCMGSGLGG